MMNPMTMAAMLMTLRLTEAFHIAWVHKTSNKRAPQEQ